MCVPKATNININDVLKHYFIAHIKAYCSSRYCMEYTKHYKIWKMFGGD